MKGNRSKFHHFVPPVIVKSVFSEKALGIVGDPVPSSNLFQKLADFEVSTRETVTLKPPSFEMKYLGMVNDIHFHTNSSVLDY